MAIYYVASARRVHHRVLLRVPCGDVRQHPRAGVEGEFGIVRVRGEQSDLTDGWWTEDRRARHSGAI
ncbi:MAG: hypothetical protein CL414_08110 [Acidimicrobiaceae bacterium]|nr:hypothetical protein [Acidimicrobiaceae bacterium]